jgi:hypothetical protein
MDRLARDDGASGPIVFDRSAPSTATACSDRVHLPVSRRFLREPRSATGSGSKDSARLYFKNR